VEELARVLGRLLAEAHVRSEAVDHGRPVGPLIAAALARHEADFPAEVAAFVAAAVPLALADHRRFAGLLAADVDPRRLGASASDAPWRSP
jgi:hypothetical protein